MTLNIRERIRPAFRVLYAGGLFALIPLTLADAVSAQPSVSSRCNELIDDLADPALRLVIQGKLCAKGSAVVPQICAKLLKGWAVMNADQQDRTRVAALQVLQHLGPLAADSVDTLLACLQDEWCRRPRVLPELVCALQCAALYNRKRVPALQRLFWDREEVESRFNLHPLQVQALRAVLTVDPDLSITDLGQALNARNPYVVTACCAVVAYRAREIIADPDAKEQIVETLASRIHMEFPRSGVVNWFSEDRLLTGGTGPSDYFDIIHLPASRAIASIVPRHRDAVAAHIHHLRSVDPRERLRAAMYLGAMGEAGEAGVKPLYESTRDADRRVALSAITALGMIGPSAKYGIPTLEALAAHAEPAFARRAKAALKSIGLQHDDTWRFWHRTGFKASEGRLVDGKAEGHWIFWYRSGHKRAEGDFHKGVHTGFWTFWDIAGRLQKRGPMKDGVGDGYWEFPRQSWLTGIYKDGVRVSAGRDEKDKK